MEYQLIDGEGYRQNVGIVIFNSSAQVLWARRIGQNSWQFPQGGIKHGENPEGAMYRELREELGLTRNDVTYIQSSRSWLKYNLPSRMVHWDEKPVCVGQRQKWFLLKINDGADRKIAFHKSSVPAEFDGKKCVVLKTWASDGERDEPNVWVFEETGSGLSNASYAIRFAASQDGIRIVLSGFS